MITYHLKRKTLNNVTDAAGLWQHEGGDVFLKDKQVGNYLSYKRVTTGATEALNTASVTLTIFLGRSRTGAPENLTFQGSHDFSSGNEVGSISAASATQAANIGKNTVRLLDDITIG